MPKEKKDKKKKSRKPQKQLTPIAMTFLENDGWFCDKAEHYNYFAKRRFDLFGFADIVALKGCIMAVQVTSGAHHAERRHKILGLEGARRWLKAKGNIMILSFSERKRKDEKNFWEPRVEFITLEDFDNGEQEKAVTKRNKKTD